MKRIAVPLLLLAVVLVAWLWSDSGTRGTRRRSAAETQGSARDKTRPRGADGADPAQATQRGPATVKGVVTARHGPLWGARVRAVRNGEVLGTAHTGPNGAYEITLTAPVSFDLHVDPDTETNLRPARRFGIELLPAAAHNEDVALTPGNTLSVQLLDPAGRGLNGVVVLAVEREVAAGVGGGVDVHPDEFVGKEVQGHRSGPTGSVTFLGLPDGSFRLLLGSESWKLTAPLYVWADVGRVVAQAVPAFSVNVRVHDIQTREPVDRFTVRLGFPRTNHEPLLLEGRDGKLACRRRWSHAGVIFARVDIEAEGYLRPLEHNASSIGRARGPVHCWLIPAGPANTTIRVRYADDTAYRGDARLSIRSIREGTATVRLSSTEPGVFTTTLPVGRWHACLELASLLFPSRIAWGLTVTESSDVEKELTIPAGGTLILRRPAGWNKPGYSGYPAYVRRVDPSRHAGTWLGPEGARFEGVLPGLYEVGCEERVDRGSYSTHSVRWFRTVTIGVGDEVEVVMPDR